MGRLNTHSFYFSFKFWGWGVWREEEDFFSIFLFPTCSLEVAIRFPRVFPIAPRFNLICFAQSPPLLTYTGGPKGEALHFSIGSSILGSLHGFNFFFVMDQSSWLITKKKEVGLVRHPQLINMEQNTCVSTLIVCTYKGVCGRDVIMSLLRSCIFLLANFHILVTWNVKQEYFGATSMFFEEKIGGLLERIVLLVKTFVTFWRGAIFCQFFFLKCVDNFLKTCSSFYY